MSDAANTPSTESLAIQALASAFGGSMKAMAMTAEVQQIAILGLGVILACLPDTASIPQDRLTAALAILTQGRSKEFTDKLATFIATAMAASRQIPAIAASIEASKAQKS
jgi:hypothetical protein